jgi:hypothetical protein
MTNILWTFQHQLTGLKPPLLLVIALVTIVAGLFVLLGGLGFRRALFLIIGAYCGGVFVISGKCPNTLLAIAAVGVGITLALFLQDSFLVLVLSVFTALYGYSILIHPYVGKSDELMPIMRDLTIGVPFYNWPMLLGLIILPVAAKATWFQGTSTTLCSLAGAVLLFAAIIMLYVYNGLAVVADICSKQEIFLPVFASVVVVGSIIQLFLLTRLSTRIAAVREAAKFKAKHAKKGKSGESDQQSAQKKTAWRTA